MTEQDARGFIEGIAAEKRGQDSADLRNALRLLAEELNSKDSHFILELIQNAEDNRYSGANPELHISIIEANPCGVPGVTFTLVAQNNEVGFQPENVRSLSSVGQSTKKKEDSSGYIGEKGIGFKSVFRITDHPHIFSGPFRFQFKKPTGDEPIGYILPHWVPSLPDVAREGFTTICLPLLPGKRDAIASQLASAAPETLLFLKKIRTLRLGADRCVAVEGSVPRLRLHGPCGVSEYFVHSVTREVPEHARDERRTGVTRRDITIALPIREESLPEANVFAFLPTEIRSGLPYLLNADFVVNSNREGILQDRPWNVWLRDQIGGAFAQAFLALLEEPGLRRRAWRLLPPPEPSGDRHAFFEPTVAIAYRELGSNACIVTDSEKVVRPETVVLPTPSMRKVVELSGGRGPNMHLIHPEWSQAPRSVLDELGVREPDLAAFLDSLNDADWLEQQSIAWWLAFLNCCRDNRITRDMLQGFPIFKCHDGHCRGTDSTVYWGPSTAWDSSMIRPEWPEAHLLDSELQAAISRNAALAVWYKDTFGLPLVGLGQYIGQSLCPWIHEVVSDGRIRDAISVTVFIAKQCHEDKSLREAIGRKLYWVHENGYVIEVQDPGSFSTVTPVGFDRGVAWYRVFQSQTDRQHLRILHPGYKDWTTVPERECLWRLMRLEGVTDCPMASRDNGGGYRCPQWLEALGGGQTTQGVDSDCVALEQWLEARWKISPDRFLAAEWLGDSPFLEHLRGKPWFPTTRGRAAPAITFVATEEIRDFLGNKVPYSKSALPPDLQDYLGVRNHLSPAALIDVLRSLSARPHPPDVTIVRIYKRLDSHEFDPAPFREEPLVWLAKPESRWLRADEVTWKDYGAEMDSLVWSVERTYGDHDLRGFFTSKIGVAEKPTAQRLLAIWAELSQTLPDRPEVMRKRIGILLTSLGDSTFLSEPWWPERRDSLRVWTESNRFEDPAEVYVPDSGHAEELFRGQAEIAWLPKGIAKRAHQLLRDIGCRSLAESLRARLPERLGDVHADGKPTLLTQASKELVLLSTKEHPISPDKESLLKTMLATRECGYPELKIRYELVDSPWWTEARAAAHWDPDAARLLLDPKCHLEEQRADAAKSLAWALYPGDTSQHERLFVLLSKTPELAAKHAKEQKWEISTKHTAWLKDAGLESCLTGSVAAEPTVAGESADARPQRHEFAPVPATQNQGLEDTQCAPRNADRQHQANGGEADSSSNEASAASAREGEGSLLGRDETRASGQGSVARESSGRGDQSTATGAHIDDEPTSEVARKVKYPHDEKALFPEDSLSGRRGGPTRESRPSGPSPYPSPRARLRETPRNRSRDRTDIEKAAMAHVKRALEELYPGCSVHDVSNYRGIDYVVDLGRRNLRHTKLRVEVKGHSGEGNIVVMTPNEIDEARDRGNANRWELWNVTHLASPSPVTITRYASVPDHAVIRETGFRVDLTRCMRA